MSQAKNGRRRRSLTLLRAYWSVPIISIFSRLRGQAGDAEVSRKKFLAATTPRNKITLLRRTNIREIINCLAKTSNVVCKSKVTKQARNAARIPVYSQNRSAIDEAL